MDISFIEEGHRYFIKQIPVPSITQTIDKAGITDYSKITAEFSSMGKSEIIEGIIKNEIKGEGIAKYIKARFEDARQFGTAVHKTTELYDRGILNESTLDPRLCPYLEGWILFLKDTGFRAEGIERIVGSEKYMFAGRLDRDGVFPLEPRKKIVEIKTSFEMDEPATALQTAAQELGIQETMSYRAGYDRIAILLKPDRKYELSYFKDKTDRAVFLAAHTTNNYKRRHKR